jgi:hypothetical protein
MHAVTTDAPVLPGELQPKLLTVLREGVSARQLAQDVLAGVIVGIVALPLAIAFAIASGVKPEQGLYTAIVAGFLVSVLGGSRVQIGGPTGAFIVTGVAGRRAHRGQARRGPALDRRDHVLGLRHAGHELAGLRTEV